MKQTYTSEVFFWSHFIFFIGWFGPFFIPFSVWPEKLFYQFWFMAFIVGLNYAWGLFYYFTIGKYVFSCPWTTLTQSLRGYTIKDRRNYEHSFVGEIMMMTGIHISNALINVFMLGSFFLVGIWLYLA